MFFYTSLSRVSCQSRVQQFKKSGRIGLECDIAIGWLAGHAPNIADGATKTWAIAAIDFDMHGFELEQIGLNQVRDHARIVQGWPGKIVTALVRELEKLEQFGGEMRDSSIQSANAFSAFWRSKHLMRQVQTKHR
jgi:hypothetical protein